MTVFFMVRAPGNNRIDEKARGNFEAMWLDGSSGLQLEVQLRAGQSRSKVAILGAPKVIVRGSEESRSNARVGELLVDWDLVFCLKKTLSATSDFIDRELTLAMVVKSTSTAVLDAGIKKIGRAGLGNHEQPPTLKQLYS